MKKSDVEILRRGLGKYHKVQITRSMLTNTGLNGFVLGLSDALALVFKFHDFYPEGCSVIRLRDIGSVHSGECERFWERMLAAEGLLDSVGISTPLPLDDMETLLKHLRDAKRPAIVEVETEGQSGRDEVFLIGRIVRVADGQIWIHYFDELGQWDTEPVSIDVARITHVQIETPYMETFLRNMPSFPGDVEEHRSRDRWS